MTRVAELFLALAALPLAIFRALPRGVERARASATARAPIASSTCALLGMAFATAGSCSPSRWTPLRCAQDSRNPLRCPVQVRSASQRVPSRTVALTPPRRPNSKHDSNATIAPAINTWVAGKSEDMRLT